MEFGDTGQQKPGMVRLFINIGKKSKAERVGDIVGAIAGESGIAKVNLVGTIDMFDKLYICRSTERICIGSDRGDETCKDQRQKC